MMYYQLTPEEQRVYTSIDHDFDNFLLKMNSMYSGSFQIAINTRIIKKAYAVAKYWHRGVMRLSGQIYLYHPLEVFKKTFSDGFVDSNLLAAALLHDTVEDTKYTLDRLEEDFNSEVRAYVELVTKYRSTQNETDGITNRQAEFLTDERYFEEGQKNPFALYIKFVDRYHNLITYSRAHENIKGKVAHTTDVLIPLARKIGCNLIADQLEDACMLALNPDEYASIHKQQQSFIACARKQVTKLVSEIASHASDRATLEILSANPSPKKIYDEIKKSYPRETINLKREDSFSCYRYKPYMEVSFNILNPSKKPLYSQFYSIVRELADERKFTILEEGTQYSPYSNGIEYIVVKDNYHNIIKFVLSANGGYRKYCNSITDYRFSRMYRGSLLPKDKKIKIYTRDGNPFEIEKGATVLDFAFILNSEIGSHYNGAIVNGTPVDIDYVLCPEDRVNVLKADEVTAQVSWFAILETKTAINRLIPTIEDMVAKGSKNQTF